MDHSLWALQKRGKEVQSLPISTSFQWCGIMQDRHKTIWSVWKKDCFSLSLLILFSSLQGGVRLRNFVQVTIAGQRGGVGEVSAEKMFSVLLLFLLFVPREILMRKWKTEVVDMMFWLGRGSIVGLISEERGHEGAIGRFGKQERFCQSSSAAWSRTRAVISDLLCN